MKTYKLQADTVTGIKLVGEFDVEPTTQEIFCMSLKDCADDEILCAEVDQATFDKIKGEYGVVGA